MRVIVTGLILMGGCGSDKVDDKGKGNRQIDTAQLTDGVDVDGDGFVEDDCNDEDETVFPGALEVLGDGLDHDCDGDPNRTALVWATGMTGVRVPTVGATTEHYVLTTAADTYTPDYTDVGISLIFDLTAKGQQQPREDVLWTGASSDEPLGPQVDMPSFGENFFGIGNYQRPSDTAYYTTIVKTNWDWTVEAFKRTPSSEYHGLSGPFSDVSARLAGTELRVASCGPGAIHAVALTANDLPFGAYANVSAEIPGEGATHCGLQHGDGNNSVLHMGDGGGISSWDIRFGSETISAAAEQPFANLSANNIRIDRQWIVIATTDGVTLSDESGDSEYRFFVGQNVLDADVSWFEGHAVAAVVISGDLHLAWGPDPDDFSEVRIPDIAGITGVSIYRDADRVFVAVSDEDTVGWFFLAPPPV